MKVENRKTEFMPTGMLKITNELKPSIMSNDQNKAIFSSLNK